MAQVNHTALKREPFAPPYVALRDQLIAARTAAGLTQQALADRLKRPQSFVAKYERGERSIDVVELISIGRVLGVDLSAVLRAVAATI